MNKRKLYQSSFLTSLMLLNGFYALAQYDGGFFSANGVSLPVNGTLNILFVFAELDYTGAVTSTGVPFSGEEYPIRLGCW